MVPSPAVIPKANVMNPTPMLLVMMALEAKRLDAHNGMGPHLWRFDCRDHMRAEDFELEIGVLISQDRAHRARDQENHQRKHKIIAVLRKMRGYVTAKKLVSS